MKKNIFDIDPEQNEDEPSGIDFTAYFEQVILNNYNCCDKMPEADYLMSITEIYDMFQKTIPSQMYTPTDIINSLIEKGFSSYRQGEAVMWLFCKK